MICLLTIINTYQRTAFDIEFHIVLCIWNNISVFICHIYCHIYKIFSICCDFFSVSCRF